MNFSDYYRMTSFKLLADTLENNVPRLQITVLKYI